MIAANSTYDEDKACFEKNRETFYMAKRKNNKVINILKGLLKKKGIDVEKIIIYGSYARGDEMKESDIDIMIISKDFENKDIFDRVEIADGLHSELVEKIRMPVDILYYSPSEWEEGSSIIISQAKEEGIAYS